MCAARSAPLPRQDWRTDSLGVLILMALVLLGVIGCGASWSPGGPSTLEPFSQLDLSSSDQEESGDNESFAEAELLPLRLGEDYTVSGLIDSASDVDIYDLGAVRSGDRILAEVFADDSLEGAIALFNGAGESLLVNDSQNVYRGRLGPYVDLVLKHDGDHAYLVVASTSGSDTIGGYTLAVRMTEGESLPSPIPQTVLLNFAGASGIGFGGRPDADIPGFDAADISSEFEGKTGDMVARIVEFVREDYAGLNVEVLSTSEGADDDGEVTRIHFGTYDPGLLGVAEGVDEYNSSTRQDAIVFTDTFAAFNTLDPTVEEMALAIANVASHEIGHLLGLVTSDSTDIMDITASLSQLMTDQAFETATLHPTVFPVGAQDSAAYLVDSVGGDAESFKLVKRLAVRRRALNAHPREVDLPRDGLQFGSCGPIHGSGRR